MILLCYQKIRRVLKNVKTIGTNFKIRWEKIKIIVYGENGQTKIDIKVGDQL